jgi:hypothetical protein
VKLDHISLADEAQPQGAKRYSELDTDIPPRFPLFLMHVLMHEPAFGGEHALAPDLFVMDQGTLPLAKSKMLQGRKLNQIVHVVHALLIT